VAQVVFATLCLLSGVALLLYAILNQNSGYYWDGSIHYFRFYKDYYALFSTGIWTSVFVSIPVLIRICYHGIGENVLC